jgi:catechol-2,3-dioxygenase
MPQEQAPRLSHVGLYVRDVPKMIDFYTKVLGFVVSDGAPDGRITFLSRNPSDHHQVVLVRGRTTDPETPMVQQVSFNVGTLANVQRACRSPAASRSISTRAKRRSTATPKPIVAPSPASSRWRNGAPRSAKRSPRSSKRAEPLEVLPGGTP